MKVSADKHFASSSVIRSFVAVEIPGPVQALMVPIQEGLRQGLQAAGGKASWTKPGNFHITLKFLGDIHTKAIGDVSHALQTVAETQSPFQMELGGIGVFPNPARPRVVWCGLKTGAPALSRLAESVAGKLTRLGYPREKRFHPHLTVARLRNRINLKPLLALFQKYDTIEDAVLTAREITFMQSRLHPKGAIYTPLKTFHFGNIHR